MMIWRRQQARRDVVVCRPGALTVSKSPRRTHWALFVLLFQHKDRQHTEMSTAGKRWCQNYRAQPASDVVTHSAGVVAEKPYYTMRGETQKCLQVLASIRMPPERVVMKAIFCCSRVNCRKEDVFAYHQGEFGLMAKERILLNNSGKLVCSISPEMRVSRSAHTFVRVALVVPGWKWPAGSSANEGYQIRGGVPGF